MESRKRKFSAQVCWFSRQSFEHPHYWPRAVARYWVRMAADARSLAYDATIPITSCSAPAPARCCFERWRTHLVAPGAAWWRRLRARPHLHRSAGFQTAFMCRRGAYRASRSANLPHPRRRRNWETLPRCTANQSAPWPCNKGDSKVVVVGALDGVYRSKDGGDTWERLSPAHFRRHKNIESIARSIRKIPHRLCRTWHLAWKTSDAGANWQHINKGHDRRLRCLSVIVDLTTLGPFRERLLGNLQERERGNLFTKIQGIPFSARRTRVLKQDRRTKISSTRNHRRPLEIDRYWQGVEACERPRSRRQMTCSSIRGDSRRVLLATDRSRRHGLDRWRLHLDQLPTTATRHRYVSAILADNKDASTLYVGVVNDREYGGVFHSNDAGQHWSQKAAGLGGKRCFRAQTGSRGMLVAAPTTACMR